MFAQWFSNQNSDAFSFFDAVTGGSFLQMSVFALNITPYITSSIIMQLLTIAIPKLEEMQRDGEDGRKKIVEITRYLTIALALIESIAMAVGFGKNGYLTAFNAMNVFMVIVTLTAGSAVLMWIGERITEKGVGNGISIVLTINIISRIPSDFASLFEQFVSGKTVAKGVLAVVIILAVILLTVVFVVLLQGAREKNSGTVLQEDPGKKTGWRSVNPYSAQGQYRRRYPGNLRTVSDAVPGRYRFPSGKRKRHRNRQQDLKGTVPVKLV